jgi:hypothetical protein
VIREESVAEALIRQRIEDSVKALRAKDIDGVMSSMHTTSFRSISLRPCDTLELRENVEPGKKPSLDLVAPWAMSYAI